VAITGGARGIGLATAKELKARGATVWIGDLDPELVAAESARLDINGAPLDVTDTGSFAAFLDSARSTTGIVDVLINNAGIMPTGPFLDQSEEVAEAMFDVNVHGMLNGVRLALPEMLDRGRGQIVNVASVAGRSVAAGMVTYCGTKHAVVGITRGLRREHHGSGVHFTLVMPTFTATRLTTGATTSRVPVAQPDEIAAGIANVICEPRDEVVLPRSASALLRLSDLMPRALSDWTARRIGTDAMFIDEHGNARITRPPD
jgi:NAD(P)-dependent dehydrogenase (short-subunit alcohol dehydrogenase family)